MIFPKSVERVLFQLEFYMPCGMPTMHHLTSQTNPSLSSLLFSLGFISAPCLKFLLDWFEDKKVWPPCESLHTSSIVFQIVGFRSDFLHH